MNHFAINGLLGGLRADAQAGDEHAAGKLWVHFLSKHIFTDAARWVVSQEQPPRSHHSQRRMDILVEEFLKSDGRRGTLRVVLIGEGKKARASGTDVTEVEVQAYEGCTAHMLHAQRDWVWALTYCGSEGRLWACNKNAGFLEPVYPRDYNFGDRKLYIDIANGFMEQLIWIRENSVPTEDMFEDVNRSLAAGTTVLPTAVLGSSHGHPGYAAVSTLASTTFENYGRGAQASAAGPSFAAAARGSDVIDPNQHVFLELAQYIEGGTKVKGTRPDGTAMRTPTECWAPGQVRDPQGNIHACVAATLPNSGNQYWAWMIEPEAEDAAEDNRKNKGKAKRHK
ncbi:hypothetical protein HRG_000746 [Hirsutella rhossiliensis]|uniref:Uncharacterized protein n=1 Tax=Hirsutella rhossiliensis TaxID=111463 RepID=A0A9P8SN80_9HYPO|nr:uncharacterized protein HRG_00746 [Hirsutella rhossiliensis]KAH0968104.1 hypothetical protein HRG_00746 [Hirsutella rhossiliensis]